MPDQEANPVSTSTPGVGAPQSTPQTGEPVAPKPTEPGAPLSPGPGATPAASPTQVAPPPPKKGVPKALLLAAGLLVVGVLAFIASRFITKSPTLFGKKGEIVWWGIQLDEASLAPLIEEYREGNPDVKITYIKQTSKDYRERLTNSLARGEGPDIFHFHNSWVPMFSEELDTLPSSVMSAEEFSQTFYPVIISDLTTKEGLVGIPLGFDAITLYVNQDILASAAKTPPETWDELRNLAKELTQKDEQDVIIQSGVALGITENVDHWPEILGLMMYQNGVNLAKPTGQLAEDAVKFYSVFSKVDRVWNATLPTSTLAFANGKVAMYFGPTWRAFEISQINPELKFKTVALPQIRKDDPGQPDVAYATYWVEGVWARSTNKEVAWDFLKFMSKRESQEKLYESVSKTKLVGEPYPRVDMGFLLREHQILGSVISLAPNARSWYLASDTFDGPTGINSQISAIFEVAIEELNSKIRPQKALEPVAEGVAEVLAQYGIRVR